MKKNKNNKPKVVICSSPAELIEHLEEEKQRRIGEHGCCECSPEVYPPEVCQASAPYISPEESTNFFLAQDGTKTKGGWINLKYDAVDREAVMNDLIAIEQHTLETMNPKIRDNGLISTDDGLIEPFEEPWPAAFIPAVAFVGEFDEGGYAGCNLVNTLNKGIRYASVDSEGNTIDCGPVVTPAVVGNVRKPHGLYIPFNNRNSIIDGINFCHQFLDYVDDKEFRGGSDHYLPGGEGSIIQSAIDQEKKKKFGW